MLLRYLDAEIIDEMSTNQHFALPVLRHFDVSPNISASNGRRNLKILPLEPSHWEKSNGSSFILLRYLDAEIFGKMSKWHSRESDLLTFRQLSQHPDILEAWNYYHSIPLNETVLMVVFLGFYDHWMLRYLMKSWVVQYRNVWKYWFSIYLSTYFLKILYPRTKISINY